MPTEEMPVPELSYADDLAVLDINGKLFPLWKKVVIVKKLSWEFFWF